MADSALCDRTRLPSQKTDLPKADLGTGLGLLKQQLDARARGEADAVECCRARHPSPVNKRTNEGKIQSV